MPMLGCFLIAPGDFRNVSGHTAAILLVVTPKPLLQLLLLKQDNDMYNRQREQKEKVEGQVIGEEGIAQNPENGLDISGMTDAGVDTLREENPLLTAREFGNANHYRQREVLPIAEIDCHGQ